MTILLMALLAVGNVLPVVAQVFSAPQGSVENVRFEQTAAGAIVVTYDLTSSDPSAAFQIMLEVSHDAGKTFTIKPVSVTGDIGPGVRPGRGKRIVWEAGRDVETLVIDQFRFNVRAISGAATPAASATLIIRTTPPGATVLVDGVDRGQTPLTLTNVGPGARQIVVRREGYLENKQTVQVRAGENAPVDIALTATTATANTGASQPQVKSGGGINPLVWVAIAGAGAAGGIAAASGGSKPNGGGNGGPVACTGYSVSPGSLSFVAGGGAQNVSIQGSPSGCNANWTATANASWIALSPATGSGPAITIGAQNNTGPARSGAVSINGQQVTVEQAGVPTTPCAYTLTRGFLNFGASFGANDIELTVSPQGCTNPSWRSEAGQPWITVTPATGTGSATLRVTVQSNAGGERASSVRILDINTGALLESTPVNQAGAAGCSYAASFGGSGDPVNSDRTTVPGNCSTLPCAEREFTITANSASCFASAPSFSVPSWLRVTPTSTSGIYRGTTLVTDRNPTGAARTGEIRFNWPAGSASLTVVQCAGTCP